MTDMTEVDCLVHRINIVVRVLQTLICTPPNLINKIYNIKMMYKYISGINIKHLPSCLNNIYKLTSKRKIPQARNTKYIPRKIYK